MVIKVSEIPEEGLRLEGLAAFPEPFQDRTWRLEDVLLAVEKDGDVVFVHGRVRSQRAAGMLALPRALRGDSGRERRDAARARPAARGEERELGRDDLETDVYDHDQIDLNALLETETTLGLPMKPLCSEGCRGLCPTCGANRNAAPCACAPAADPRWSPLKGLADRLSK